MRIPLDLGGVEILIAVALLISGTIVVCVALALVARAVDHVWDVVSTADQGAAAAPRSPVVSRTGLAALLAGGVVVLLTWVSAVVGRSQQLG